MAVHLAILSVGLPRTSWSHLLLERAPELEQVVPTQRPTFVVHRPEETTGSLADLVSWSPPSARVVWHEDRLYVASHPSGLLAIDAAGDSVQLNSEAELGALAPSPDGFWAIDRSTNTIITLDAQGQIADRSLVDSSQSPNQPWHLASVPEGGL